MYIMYTFTLFFSYEKKFENLLFFCIINFIEGEVSNTMYIVYTRLAEK